MSEADRLIMPEGNRRQGVERMPGRVRWKLGLCAARDECEVDRVDDPEVVGVRLLRRRVQLLEVSDLFDAHLLQKVTPSRTLQGLAAFDETSGQCPRARFGFAPSLPEQHLEFRLCAQNDAIDDGRGKSAIDATLRTHGPAGLSEHLPRCCRFGSRRRHSGTVYDAFA